MPKNLSETVRTIRQGEAVGVGEIPFGWVEITGPDAAKFLQNRTSNDVLALKDGEGHLNTVLDRGAHVEAVFSLHRLDTSAGASYWALTEAAQVPALITALKKFLIMEQVVITDQSAAVKILTLQGQAAAGFLKSALNLPALNPSDDSPTFDIQKLAAYGILKNGDGGFLLNRTLSGETGFCLVLPSEKSDDLLARLTAENNVLPLTAKVLDTLRLEAGIPLFGRDMDVQTLLPETGLEQVAVSYSKGCYLGQETVARVKTYGSVQKALMGLVFENTCAESPAEGTPCLLAEATAGNATGPTIGALKSVGYSPMLEKNIALAYLYKEYRIPGKALSLQFGENKKNYDVQVVLLPFYDGRDSRSGSDAPKLLDAGLKAFADGRDEEAIATLRQALRLDDTLGDAYEALGVILGRQEQYDEAIALMEKLRELEPERVMAYTNLSIYYLKKGDKERAEEEKANATRVAMANAMKRKLGATAQPAPPDEDEMRQKKEAALRERASMFEEALAHSPGDPLGNFGLATTYTELGEFEKAVPAFEKTIAAQPTHTVAYLSLGKALEALGKKSEAKAIYQQGVDVASRRRDLQPLTEMQQRLEKL